MAVSNLERLANPTLRTLSLPHVADVYDVDAAEARGSRKSLGETLDRQGESLNGDMFNAMFDRLQLRYEEGDQLLRCLHGDPDRPCYTEALLTDLLRLFATLRDSYSGLDRDAFPFRYLVWESSRPGIWNLGGDLALFIRLIDAGDIEALRDYAYRCVNTVYQNYAKNDLPYLTIALVQGDALGGGFEAVLSNDIIIAEEHCQFGLPEILFNMFPGMGAYSFLSRRLDPARARSMIQSGRLYAARELHDLGLIDVVVPSGEGEAGLRAYLDRNRRRHRALLSMAKVSRRCHNIGQDEMIDVADIWVENAMGISSSDRRRMQRLVNAQSRRHALAASARFG
jgi:DSF synthase